MARLGSDDASTLAAVQARRKAAAEETERLAAVAAWDEPIAPARDAADAYYRCFGGYDFSGTRHVDPATAATREMFLRALEIKPEGTLDLSVEQIQAQVAKKQAEIDPLLPAQLKGVDYRLIGYAVMVGLLPLDLYVTAKGASWAFVAGSALDTVRQLRTLQALFSLYEKEVQADAGTPNGSASGSDIPDSVSGAPSGGLKG